MQYRKESSKSKKFSSTPEDFNKLVSDYLTENFSEALKTQNKYLKVQGRIYPEEVLVKISLYENGRIHCDNFQGSMDYDSEKKDTLDRIQDIMDSLACMLEQFLEAEGDIEMPKAWNEFDFENRKVYMMYSTENDELEAEAKKLLGDMDELDAQQLDEEMVGVDFFKEAEERFRQNLH